MNKQYFLVFIVIMALVSGALTGCAKQNPGSTVNLSVQSAHYLNPDINGRASPVVVTAYQLKSPFAFQQASYDAIADNSARVLGADLIDKDTFEIRPDSNKVIPVTLTPNTKYLGIVAAYRNINQAVSWHKVVKITGGQTIRVDLESQGMVVSN